MGVYSQLNVIQASDQREAVMELILVWRVLRRYWWLMLIPVLVTAALTLPAALSNRATLSGGFGTTIRYSAAQQLDAIPNRDGDYQDVWLASELTVNALTDWITSNSFKQAVAEEVAAGGASIDLTTLGIAADNERSVGRIDLSWPNADELNTIAQAMMTVLQTQTEDAFPQLGGEPAQVTIIDTPVIVPAPPPLTDRFGPFLRIGLGLLAGIGLAFLAFYLDPTLRYRDDVEAIGLPVLAPIPRK